MGGAAIAGEGAGKAPTAVRWLVKERGVGYGRGRCDRDARAMYFDVR